MDFEFRSPDFCKNTWKQYHITRINEKFSPNYQLLTVIYCTQFLPSFLSS